MAVNTLRTTVALPVELLEAADRAVRAGKVRNRNELMTQALQHELAALERTAIDFEFAAMEEDAAYQAETRQVLSEFARADWEAFQLAEQPFSTGENR